ncbi:DUF6510 family protein [Streptomyces sp. NBC_01497]|uniref:DUF6510 family protein n=1 Tax=Streptomyces sp. NBC_01497 TaxID=2903885 RepID=UPI002E35E25A|nr:DUF6510 family protein [Streptomyces sp. NBC_01497]
MNTPDPYPAPGVHAAEETHRPRTARPPREPYDPSPTNPDDDGYEDGNALAGPLSEIFTPDMTRALTHCAGCGTTGPMALLRLYEHAPGLVARCPTCGDVVLRMVRTEDAAWLDLRGTVSLDIPLTAP